MTTGTNVPAPTWGTQGFLAPSGPAVLAGVQADYSAAFNAALNFSLNTPQGQLTSSEAAVIANAYSTFVYFSQQTDPAYAQGRSQDAIGRIYFLTRNPAEPTTLQVTCVGAAGVVIPTGSTISDVSGNIYAATVALTIPAGGSVTGSFACTTDGPVTVPGASQISIYQAIPGWNSVTVASGIQGVNVESRAAFEVRRQDSVAANSMGPIGSIIGAVAAVPGVTDYYGYNNVSATATVVGGISIAGNSVYICVAGGTSSAVATAILSKKSAGCGMTGNTAVTVYDANPLYPAPIAYTITYEIPTPLQLMFAVTLVNNSMIPSNAAALIQAALIQAVSQGSLPNNPTILVPGLKARIGNTLYAVTYVQAITALGSWAQVASINIGSPNTPDAIIMGRVAGTALVVATTAGVVETPTGTVTVTLTGPVLSNQYLFDPLGQAPLGSFIISGATSAWFINNSVSVAGAVFSATTDPTTGSGTHLVAVSVTGTIGIGNVFVSTSGLPFGAAIISQISGTVGGVGTYVLSTSTSVTTTVTVTANSIIRLVTADQSNVAINISQVAQLSAVVIGVTHT